MSYNPRSRIERFEADKKPSGAGDPPLLEQDSQYWLLLLVKNLHSLVALLLDEEGSEGRTLSLGIKNDDPLLGLMAFYHGYKNKPKA